MSHQLNPVKLSICGQQFSVNSGNGCSVLE